MGCNWDRWRIKRRMKDYLISEETEVIIAQFVTQNLIGQNEVLSNKIARFLNQ